MHIFNTLAPVFLLIALGAVLRRRHFADDGLLREFNRLAYWVGLPCLLFVKIATAGQIGPQAGTLFLVLVIATAGLIVLGLLAGWALGLRRERLGSFVQVAFRGNLAFIGLPVIFFAFAAPAGRDAGQDAQTLAALGMGPLIVVYNAVAVISLLAGRHTLRWSAVRHMGFQMVTNPLLLACVAGSGWSLLGWPVPLAAERTLHLTGQLALPLALIGIGGRLVMTGLKGQTLPCLAGAIVKVGVAPVLGLALCRLFGADDQVTAIALILLACPTAVASYVLADQLRGDVELTAGSIVLSTLLSALSLGLVVGMT